MNLFYASFIPGLQGVVEGVIKERLSDVKIHKLLDGAVLFETQTSYDKLNFFCFNNIFAVISVFPLDKSDKIEAHVRDVLDKANGAQEVIKNNSKSIKTFRMVFSKENVPASVDEKLRVEIERYIARLCGLKVNRTKADTEFWFLSRKEEKKEDNFSVFMKRLTLRSSWEKTLHKGELPPPLAWTLCLFANLVHSDTVIDPFCGYGSIPNAALKHFHISKFIACDNNREAALYTKARFKSKKENFIFYEDDFASLPSLVKEKSIDAVVTDPPWGHFKEIDSGAFYKKMFEVFGKLLKQDGRAVVLCANKDGFLESVPSSFMLQESIQILLSGKKAVIYRFKYSIDKGHIHSTEADSMKEDRSQNHRIHHHLLEKTLL